MFLEFWGKFGREINLESRESKKILIPECGIAMNDSLRLVRRCLPPTVYYERHGPDGADGTTWFDVGQAILADRQSILPSLELVTDLPNGSFDLSPNTLALVDGDADVDPVAYGVSYNRFLQTDYSYPVVYEETYIISAKIEEAQGSAVVGIFDAASYAASALCVLALAVLMTLIVEKEALFPKMLLLSFGSLLSQPFPQALIDLKPLMCAVLSFATLCGALGSAMYGSVVISQLTAQVGVRNIQELEDLTRPSEEHMRIYVVAGSAAHDVFSKLAIHAQLESRVINKMTIK